MILRRFGLAAAMLLYAAAVQANPVTLAFTGVNGANDGHYYVSPYFATLNGTPITLFCIDVRNEVNFGQTWQANLTWIYPGANLSSTRFGVLPNANALYLEAAWLASQFSTHPSNYVDLQYALWNLFSPGMYKSSAASNAWLALAAQNYGSMHPPAGYGWVIITNVAPVQLSGRDQVQEFISLRPIPEPASLALFGTGLLGVATLVRRRTVKASAKKIEKV